MVDGATRGWGSEIMMRSGRRTQFSEKDIILLMNRGELIKAFELRNINSFSTMKRFM